MKTFWQRTFGGTSDDHAWLKGEATRLTDGAERQSSHGVLLAYLLLVTFLVLFCWLENMF